MYSLMGRILVLEMHDVLRRQLLLQGLPRLQWDLMLSPFKRTGGSLARWNCWGGRRVG